MALFATLFASMTCASAVPETSSSLYPSSSLSGRSVYALKKAYEVSFAERGAIEAPFALAPYTIEVLNYAHSTSIIFLHNTAPKIAVVAVSGDQATLQNAILPTLDVKPVLLPGVIAGEILAVYNDALKRDDSVVTAGPETFDVSVEIGVSYSLVAFIPNQRPALPVGMKCIAGDCNGGTVYNISLRNGKAVVAPEKII
jgi:hypothetical protein